MTRFCTNLDLVEFVQNLVTLFEVMHEENRQIRLGARGLRNEGKECDQIFIQILLNLVTLFLKANNNNNNEKMNQTFSAQQSLAKKRKSLDQSVAF